MNYILFILVAFYISNWIPIRLFVSSLGKKRLSRDISDPKLLEFIYTKTKLKLSSIRILTSTKLYGMMIGLPGFPIMILSSTLFETFSSAEIEYVVLHEAGHYELQHTLKLTIIFLLLLIPGFAILFRFHNLDIAAVILLAVITGIVNVQFGRMMEYQADRFALIHADNPKGMISATKKFARAYHRPHKIMQFLFYVGVPYENRINMAEKELLNRLTN